MINLEWLRTFRTVYKTESLTKAAELLNITQPAVSQHIAALENQAAKKLFERKSKGVQPTNYARILNNMIAHSLDDLEEVEESFSKKIFKQKTIIDFGISEHLYKSILSDKLLHLDESFHLKFGEQDKLIKEVEEGTLMAAIIPKVVNTFDTNCHILFKQKLVMVFTPDIDIKEFKKLIKKNKKQAERWLLNQNWFSHRPITPFIKQYWLNIFDKTRPSIVPKIIIPNEYEVLEQLSKSSGVALCYDTNAESFIKYGKLNSFAIKPVVERTISLLVNKIKMDSTLVNKYIELLSGDDNN